MAGTLRGLTNFHITHSNASFTAQECARNLFYFIAKFFDTHTGYSRIASYYGVNGTGFGPTGGTDGGESGDCRWGVWRNNNGIEQYDIFIGANTNVTNSTLIDPSGSYAFPNSFSSYFEYGFGAMVGWHSSGAWTGTNNNDGNDSFIAPHQWRSGSVIWPSENMRYGAAEATKNLLGNIIFSGAPEDDTYGNIIGDDDSFIIFINGTVANVTKSLYSGHLSFERYQPISASYNLPYLLHTSLVDGSQGHFQRNNTFGELGAGATKTSISIVKPTINTTHLSSSYPAIFNYDRYLTNVNWNSATDNPTGNYIISGNQNYIPEYPINLGVSAFNKQFVGYTTFTRLVNQQTLYKSKTTFNNKSRITLGMLDSAQTPSASLPWSSSFAMNTFDPNDHPSSSLFLTNSLMAQIPVTQSFLFSERNFTTTITIGEAKLYRYRIGANFFYTTTPTFTETDLIVIKEIA